MDIPLNATVYCENGRVGTSTHVVINPLNEQITHVVIRLDERPHTEYMIPVSQVGETTPASINLHLTREQFDLQEEFIVSEYIPIEITHYEDLTFGWPLVQTEHKLEEVHKVQIPLGELPVRRGAAVEATDGRIGKIDEFVAIPDGHVTHILMRNGHLWGKKDIVIPVADIADFEEQLVHLKLDKKQVEALPTIKIKR